MALYEHPQNKLSGPTDVAATMLKTTLTGVDCNTSFTVTFSKSDLQAQAILSCSINLKAQEPGVTIRFERGTIIIPGPIYCPKEFTVQRFGEHGKVIKEEKTVFQYVGSGLHFEADEVARCVLAGMKESELWGHNKSLLEMEIFDKVLIKTKVMVRILTDLQVRDQGGYVFPAGIERVT